MLKATGMCRGIRTQPAREEGKQPKLFLGLANNKRNGYPGEEEITEVMLPAEMIKQGITEKVAKLKDQMIEAPVFIAKRAWREQAYVDLILNGEIKAVASAAAPLQAVNAK